MAPKTVPDPTDLQKILRFNKPSAINKQQPEFQPLIIFKREKTTRFPESFNTKNYVIYFSLFFTKKLFKLIIKYINIYASRYKFNIRRK